MTFLKTMSAIAAAALLAGPLAFGAAEAESGARPPAAKGDRIAEAFALVSSCSTASWPKFPAECVEHPEGAIDYRVPARTVTVEERDEANRISDLIRVPASTATASR